MALRLILWCLALGAAHVGAVVVTTQPTANLVDGACLTAGSTDFGADAASATLDYFPEKFVTTAADLFTITYTNGYKVVTQTHESPNHHKTVFYQCGLGKPTIAATYSDVANSATADPILYVSVPVTSVAVASTTFIPYIELLGVRDTIKHYTSSFAKVSSTCLQTLYAGSGTVASPVGGSITADSGAEADIKAAIGDDAADTDAALNSVTFTSAGTQWSTATYREMRLTQSKETENLEVAENIGMIAAAYNLEAKANEIYAGVKGRYECVKNNVAATIRAVAAKPAPKVLWFSYVSPDSSGTSSPTYGWDVGSCPNYYCEAVTDAGGEIIEYTGVTKSKAVSNWGNYLSDAQLLEKAKDADYMIFSSISGGNTAQTVIAENAAMFAKIKAFQFDHPPGHPRVFDTTGFGQKDWMEARMAEPDVLLEDMVNALWPAATATHTSVWLKPYGVASKTKAACPNPASTDTIPQADACSAMDPNILTIAVNGAVGYGPSLAHVAAVAMTGLVAMVAM